jgi:ParB-like chromosome segregation protein Spo0J
MQIPQMVQVIELPLLHAHPKNANVMGAGVMRKLERHIAASGRYEPLVVRPHPSIVGAYEMINGHHRKKVLEKLGHAAADCVVWDLDDAQTLMVLATINRLGGEDAAGKRLDLLEALSEAMNATAGELAKLLPEEQATLEKLLARQVNPEIAAAPDLAEMPEAFMVFLKAQEKKELVAALARTDADPARALMRWAREA